MSQPSQRLRRVAIVGSRAVGKSSVTVQFVEEHFVESYYPTIESRFSKIIRYKGQDYEIEILDTAGQDEFSIINQKHLIGIHGYVLAYSVASRSSFEMIPIIRDKILTILGSDHIPAVIIGNKSDLNLQRQVMEEEGRKLAKELGCAFIETSARHNENVTMAFELLIQEIEKQASPAQPQQSGCVVV